MEDISVTGTVKTLSFLRASKTSGSGMRGPNRRGQNYREPRLAKLGPGGPETEPFGGPKGPDCFFLLVI